MNKTTHTPGPWREDDKRFNCGTHYETRVLNANGGIVVAVPSIGQDDIAIARLIAAAPDMFEACKAMLERLVKLDGFPDVTSPYSGARVLMSAAILKAETGGAA